MDDPRPGERWHTVGCNRQDNPTAVEAHVLTVIEDDTWGEEPDGAGKMKVVVYRVDRKCGPRFFCEELWLWRTSRTWERGPLPEGPKGGNDE